MTRGNTGAAAPARRALAVLSALALAAGLVVPPASAQCAVGTVCTAATAATQGTQSATSTAARTATGEPARRRGASGTSAAIAPWDTTLARASRGGAEMDEKKRADIAELCTLMTAAADRHGVPPDFFIRLIWKESRFNAGARSPVGAQGIAQFMPGTARLRKLADPFDRVQALDASASFLADMKADFGSWGLAAIGYNGGPNRVPPLVAGSGGLPYETIDYVYTITGRTAEYWAEKARRERKAAEEAAELTDAAVAGAEGSLGPATAEEVTLTAEPLERAAAAAPLDVPADATAADAPTADSPAADARLEQAFADADAPADARLVAAAATAAGEAVLGLEALPDGATSVAGATVLRTPLMRPEHEPRAIDCPTLVVALGRSVDTTPPGGGGSVSPYGAQVAGHPKRAVAMQMYARIRGQIPAEIASKGPQVVVRRFAARGRMSIHAIQFGAGTLGEAQSLCRRIAQSRAPCVAVKNG